MIKVYLLPVILEGDTEHVAGTDIIHDALLLTTEDHDIRKLIMDTTEAEHEALFNLCVVCPETTQADIQAFNSQVTILPPDPDTIRAEEILATSPEAIPDPEKCELLRIFGRRLGYRW